MMGGGGRTESSDRKDPACDGVPGVVATDGHAGGAPQPQPQFSVAAKTIDRRGQRGRVAWLAQQTVDVVFDKLRDLSDSTRDDWQAGRHVLVNLQRRKI